MDKVAKGPGFNVTIGLPVEVIASSACMSDACKLIKGAAKKALDAAVEQDNNTSTGAYGIKLKPWEPEVKPVEAPKENKPET